jgi:hypothetical protein
LEKGWALYLNALFDGYPLLRKERFKGAGHRGLVSALLAHAGIRPAVSLKDGHGRGVGPVRISRYRLGQTEIVGVLPEPVDIEEIHGRDGVRIYDDSKLGTVVAEQVEIRLPRPGDVVNVRTGEFLGHADRLRTSIVAGDALVLAVGPARPTVALSGPPAARAGDHARFAIRLEPATPRRVLRCHVFGPDGAFLPLYSRNLLVDGESADFVLPTALDDPPGSYRLKVTDILGGGAAEAAMDLR